jgi:speckle-type POZ protein
METSLLRDPDFGFCVNDCVSFKVEMTVYGDLEVVPCPDTDLVERLHTHSLEQSMYQLLQQPVHSDVTFIVGPDHERIPAHKCVLMARSPVFYAMFSHPLQEELVGEIHITDVAVPVLREVLHFMYAGQRSLAVVEQEDLFRVAVKYQIPGLVAQCEEYFIARMSVDSVLAMLEMADVFGAQHLKLKCMQYIAHNATSVVSQRAFRDLDELLLRDVHRLIDAVNKRKGRGGSGAGGACGEKERRFSNSCAIM